MHPQSRTEDETVGAVLACCVRRVGGGRPVRRPPLSLCAFLAQPHPAPTNCLAYALPTFRKPSVEEATAAASVHNNRSRLRICPFAALLWQHKLHSYHRHGLTETAYCQ